MSDETLRGEIYGRCAGDVPGGHPDGGDCVGAVLVRGLESFSETFSDVGREETTHLRLHTIVTE